MRYSESSRERKSGEGITRGATGSTKQNNWRRVSSPFRNSCIPDDTDYMDCEKKEYNLLAHIGIWLLVRASLPVFSSEVSECRCQPYFAKWEL